MFNKKLNPSKKNIIFVQVTSFIMLEHVYQKIKRRCRTGGNAVASALKIKLTQAKEYKQITN